MHRKSPEAEGQTSALIALFCVYGQPLSGYGVRILLKEWRVGEYLSVSPATIYRSLVRLEKEGLLTSKVERQGRYPASRVYRLTPAGQSRYRQLVKDVAQFRRSSHELLPFLGLGSYLPVEERIRLAQDWSLAAQVQLDELNQRIEDHRPGQTYGKPYAEWLMLHHESHRLKADIEWLNHYVKLLEQGRA